MSLRRVKNGAVVTVKSFQLARELSLRLVSLGIVPGTKVEMIEQSLHGASIVLCRGNRLVLDNSLVDNIEVHEK